MASPEAVFENAMKPYGGTFDAAKYGHDALSRMTERRRDWARKNLDIWIRSVPGMPPVHFDFVDNACVQAYAFKRDGMYFIAVYTGVDMLTFKLFSRLLADRRLLTNIGDPSKEIETPAMSTVESNILVPNNVVRRRFIEHFQWMVFRFLLFHELGHIAHGHVDYLEHKSRKPFISEFRSGPKDLAEARMLQTLEMDADSAGACEGAEVLRRVFKEGKLRSELADFYPSFREAATWWGVGVYAFFRAFGDDVVTGANLARLSHPPLRARTLMVTACAQTLIQESWGKSFADELIHSFNRSQGEVEIGFLIQEGKQWPEVPPLWMDEIRDETVVNYANSLQTHWKEKLRAELQRFAFVDLAE